MAKYLFIGGQEDGKILDVTEGASEWHTPVHVPFRAEHVEFTDPRLVDFKVNTYQRKTLGTRDDTGSYRRHVYCLNGLDTEVARELLMDHVLAMFIKGEFLEK